MISDVLLMRRDIWIKYSMSTELLLKVNIFLYSDIDGFLKYIFMIISDI